MLKKISFNALLCVLLFWANQSRAGFRVNRPVSIPISKEVILCPGHNADGNLTCSSSSATADKKRAEKEKLRKQHRLERRIEARKWVWANLSTCASLMALSVLLDSFLALSSVVILSIIVGLCLTSIAFGIVSLASKKQKKKGLAVLGIGTSILWLLVLASFL